MSRPAYIKATKDKMAAGRTGQTVYQNDHQNDVVTLFCNCLGESLDSSPIRIFSLCTWFWQYKLTLAISTSLISNNSKWESGPCINMKI